MTEAEIQDRLDRERDDALRSFESELSRMIGKAQDQTIDWALRNFDIEKGDVQPTAKTRSAMRKVTAVFMAALLALGLRKLILAFVGQFADQAKAASDLIKVAAKEADVSVPKFDLTDADFKFLSQVGVSMADLIQDTISARAQAALRKAFFSIGEMPFKSIAAEVRHTYDLTVKQALDTADTAQAAWFRVAQDRIYGKIEANLGRALKYRYSGIRDSKNRPFCQKMLEQTSSGDRWTKDEIDKMDNGPTQPKPVFLFCGGWGCRGHQWLADFAASGLI